MNIKQGYKQTEIGIIPEDWEVKQITEVCDFIVPGRNKPKLFDGTIPWITTPDLEDIGHITESRLGLFVSKEEAKSVGSKIVPAGSIIMSCVGELGIVSYTKSEIVINQQLHAFIPSDLIDRHFLLYVIKTKKSYFESIATKTAVPYLNKDNCNSIQLPIPPLPEQTAIATALSDIDALIGELDKLIAKKQGIKQATMQQLLTGKKRLAGFSGEWEVKRLGELLDYEQPTKYLVSSTEYNDHNNVAVLTAGKSFVLGYTNEEHGIFQNLPVIIFDDFTTTTKYVDFPFKVKSSAMKMLKPKNEQVNLKFLFEKIQTIRFLLNDHKRYWISEYQKLEIELPSIEEQNAIANILSDMDAEISQLEGRRAKMGELKQGMMQELLTGRIRLTGGRYL